MYQCMVILRPSLTSHSSPLYETKKEVPKFAMTVIWDPGISESLIRNCEGTETRHVLGEAKTRWIGTFPKYRVIGELSSLE